MSEQQLTQNKISNYNNVIEKNNYIISTHKQAIQREYGKFRSFQQEIKKAIFKKKKENKVMNQKIRALKEQYINNKISDNNIVINENITNFIDHIINSTNDINEFLKDLVFMDYMYFMKKSIKSYLDIQVLEYEYNENKNYIKKELKKLIK